MEGRTKFNYGTQDNILMMSDIKYMLDIIASDLSDKDKATKLYAYCNYHTLLNNRKFIKDIQIDYTNEEDTKKRKILLSGLTKLISVYENYDKKGYFDLSRNPYKCTLAEVEVRLLKINEVSSILNSNASDYNKAEKLLALFDSSESFKKSYSLFIKYGKKDARLDLARQALDDFDSLLNKFKDLEQKGIVANTKYLLSIQSYLQNYNYAKFVVSNYINSITSYKESEFLEELGIDKDIFDFCIETLEELDLDLYNKYLEKKETNKKIRCVKNAETIADLASGINTGVLSDGTQFDLLEFIKRIPFKKNNNFTITLKDFMKRNNPQDMNTIINYVYSNGLNKPATFAPLNLNSIYRVKTTINGVEITKAVNDLIIDYLRVNNIPLIQKTYALVRTKYLNGEITAAMVQEQKAKMEGIIKKQLLK